MLAGSGHRACVNMEGWQQRHPQTTKEAALGSLPQLAAEVLVPGSITVAELDSGASDVPAMEKQSLGKRGTVPLEVSLVSPL